MLQAKHGVKIVLAKNYEFDQEEYEPVFKNNYLRGLGR